MKPLIFATLGFALLVSTPDRASAQAVPHHFRSAAVAPDGAFILGLDGSVSNLLNLPAAVKAQFLQMFDQYPLETSPDLSSWTRQGVLLRTINDPSPLLYLDSGGVSGTAQFFRTPTNSLVTAFPKPTGPFAVGKCVRVLSDPSRTNRYHIPTNSSFMSTFWYPAEPPTAGRLPAGYMDRPVAFDPNFYSYYGWASQWQSVIAACVSYAYENAPPASTGGALPVVLLSHGYTSDRSLSTHLAEELASRGYIVAAVDHEDCHATMFPDARGVRRVAPGSFADFTDLAKSRIKDLTLLLDELNEINDLDPLLAGRVDLGRVGTLGHSLGGATAAEVARVDYRVRCAVLLDPYITPADHPELSTVGLQKPFLTMNSTVASQFLPPGEFAQISSNLFSLAATNSIWIAVEKATHTSFCDIAWTMDMSASTRQAALAIDAAVSWFFDTRVMGRSSGFPSNVEIANVQKK